MNQKEFQDRAVSKLAELECTALATRVILFYLLETDARLHDQPLQRVTSLHALTRASVDSMQFRDHAVPREVIDDLRRGAKGVLDTIFGDMREAMEKASGGSGQEAPETAPKH